MVSFDNMIGWMQERLDHAQYSTSNRLGPENFDSASAIYYSLIHGEFFPSGVMGDIDRLFDDLEKYGWVEVHAVGEEYPVERGDIFIWGVRGATNNQYGHAGIFLDSNDEIIHCSYAFNGISKNDYAEIWNGNAYPPVTIYRYSGGKSNQKLEKKLKNTGELNVFELKNGKVHVTGRYLAKGDKKVIYAMDAITGGELAHTVVYSTGDEFDVLLDVPQGFTIFIMARVFNQEENIDLMFGKHLVVEENPQEYYTEVGDTLWNVSEEVYGSGYDYPQLIVINNLPNENIQPNQVLKY